MVVGKHTVITIEKVKNIDALKNLNDLKVIMKDIADKCDLHIVSEAGYQFEPFGCTHVYVLSESHFSCHTYWETNSAYLDIFCCNLSFEPEKAIDLIKNHFDTETVSYITLIR